MKLSQCKIGTVVYSDELNQVGMIIGITSIGKTKSELIDPSLQFL